MQHKWMGNLWAPWWPGLFVLAVENFLELSPEVIQLCNSCYESALKVHSHLRFLGVNYCMNFSLNTGLYCTKRVPSHLIIKGQLLCGLKKSIICFVPIFLRLCELKASCHSSRLINRMCEWTLKECVSFEQNFSPVPVPIDQYGTFYDGDSYIILSVSAV